MSNVDAKELFRRFEAVRNRMGESQMKFYGESSVGIGIVSSMSNGSFPSIAKVIAIADHAGMSIDDRIGRSVKGE